jgi:hypothetical protein
MRRKVLFLDDGQGTLGSHRRVLSSVFEIASATPKAAARVIERERPFAALVCVWDPKNPTLSAELDGLRAWDPDAACLVLGGDPGTFAGRSGSEVVCLPRPCPVNVLREHLEAAAARLQQRITERAQLERTLAGSVRTLLDLLALVNPSAFARGLRVQTLIRRLSPELGLIEAWESEVAGALSQLGCVMFSPELEGKLRPEQPLSAEEEAMVAAHPAIGASLLANIPRLESVARIIARQQGPDPPEDGRHRGHSLAVS